MILRGEFPKSWRKQITKKSFLISHLDQWWPHKILQRLLSLKSRELVSPTIVITLFCRYTLVSEFESITLTEYYLKPESMLNDPTLDLTLKRNDCNLVSKKKL